MHNNNPSNNTSNNTQAFVSLKYNNLYIVGEENKVSEFHKYNRQLITMLADNKATAVIDVNEMQINSMSLLPSNKEYNDIAKANPDCAEITIRLNKEELDVLKRVRLSMNFNNVHDTFMELLYKFNEIPVETLNETPIEKPEETKPSSLTTEQCMDCSTANPKYTYKCSKEHFYTVKEVFLKNLHSIFEGGRAYTISGLVDVLEQYTEINLSDTKFWGRRLAKVLGQLRTRKVLIRQKSGTSMYWYLAKKSVNNNILYSLKGINEMRFNSSFDERGSGRMYNDERGSGRLDSDERGSGRVVSHRALTVVK